jgi:hypothetical protein
VFSLPRGANAKEGCDKALQEAAGWCEDEMEDGFGIYEKIGAQDQADYRTNWFACVEAGMKGFSKEDYELGQKPDGRPRARCTN